MQPIYEEVKDHLEISHRRSKHFPPHLHKSMECVYITQGSLEIGVAQELYHMEQGDFAIVFPEMIHHYQVFNPEGSKAIFLLAEPTLAGGFLSALQQYCPSIPVIPAAQVHPDIVYAMKSLCEHPASSKQELILHQAFMQIILARCLPDLQLVNKNTFESNDIIYQTMSYISRHFTDTITLTGMAKDLAMSPYALSRVFSSTFHTNFNQYVNEIRLNYASTLLTSTNESITDVYLNAGFESQRTFNRVFKEHYHMSPREYRLHNQEMG